MLAAPDVEARHPVRHPLEAERRGGVEFSFGALASRHGKGGRLPRDLKRGCGHLDGSHLHLHGDGRVGRRPVGARRVGPGQGILREHVRGKHEDETREEAHRRGKAGHEGSGRKIGGAHERDDVRGQHVSGKRSGNEAMGDTSFGRCSFSRVAISSLLICVRGRSSMVGEVGDSLRSGEAPIHGELRDRGT